MLFFSLRFGSLHLLLLLLSVTNTCVMRFTYLLALAASVSAYVIRRDDVVKHAHEKRQDTATGYNGGGGFTAGQPYSSTSGRGAIISGQPLISTRWDAADSFRRKQ